MEKNMKTCALFRVYRPEAHIPSHKSSQMVSGILLVDFQNKGGPENPKAKRQQTNLSNTDNWFISFSPLASFFLEDEHYGRIHCKFHFSPPAR